ncbi:MAG TPA: site-2 protease family protein [Bryobacteraceae bacterium]|nr:site-2 protease family protein [Bryobacteraceae bacterium]
MSTNGYPLTPVVPPGDGLFAMPVRQARLRPRYWLHAVLLLLTLFSTTVIGAGLAGSFAANVPFDFSAGLYGYVRVWRDPSYLLAGLPFSLTLLTILLAHEFGHYLAARYYGVDVTLPFFLPAPTLFGTLGAFIRIRSAILSRRILFDIGVAGPLAGFSVLVWFLAAGMFLSKITPGIGAHGDLIFGSPLALRLVEGILFPGASPADIALHPIARAAWIGLLATALNLLPIGQLDGGHILYAFLGERMKWFSRIFVFVLVPLGIFFAYSWLVWAVILFFFGMRHPVIVDPAPLDRARRWLGVAALIVFLLSFTVAPIRPNL